MAWVVTINSEATTLESPTGYTKCVRSSQLISEKRRDNLNSFYTASQNPYLDVCESDDAGDLNILLQEDGFAILQENGSYILL